MGFAAATETSSDGNAERDVLAELHKILRYERRFRSQRDRALNRLLHQR